MRWLLAIMMLFASAEVSAQVKMRRPFANNIAFNYGYDNRAGGGCTDYNCGGHCYDGHTGTDFPVGLGTDVVATADAVVVATFNGCANYGSFGNTCGGRCGNYVTIQYEDGTRSSYCHMRNGSIVVSNGQRVSCGQKLGQSASSGSSTGPHLHLSWVANGSTRDVSRGACTSSPGAWNQQNGYRDPVGASCSCVPSTEVCDGKDNDCDGQVDEGDVCESQWVNDRTETYAPSHTTDINGDGRADVCGRGSAGFWCHLATDDGFEPEGTAPAPLTNAAGWDHPSYYSTIRMGDIDGDGRAEICARASNGIHCWKFDGEEWAQLAGPELSDEKGWDKVAHYSTIRLADINGDGKQDLCARAGVGMLCWLSTGTGFEEESIAGPLWSNDGGFAVGQYYGTLRTGDVNGDGKDDLCIRDAEGIACALSTGDGFEPVFRGPPLTTASGWGHITYWTSIRLADVNGDGMADLCARSSTDLRCYLSEGTGFGPAVIIAELSDSSGWSDVTNHATLRTGDVNGDGAQDLCIRANAQIICYAWDGESFVRFDGPEWSDANGWNHASHYDTIRFADFNGDGREDICARASSGWLCNPALTEELGFGPSVPMLEEFMNTGGWTGKQYYTTLRFGGPACQLVESCNGRDDDCNGVIDDNPVDAGGPCDLSPAQECMRGELTCTDGGLTCTAVPDTSRPECVEVDNPDQPGGPGTGNGNGNGNGNGPGQNGNGNGDGSETGSGYMTVNSEGSCAQVGGQPWWGGLLALLFVWRRRR